MPHILPSSFLPVYRELLQSQPWPEPAHPQASHENHRVPTPSPREGGEAEEATEGGATPRRPLGPLPQERQHG